MLDKKVNIRFFPDGLIYFFSMMYPTFNAGKLIFIQQLDRLNSRGAGIRKIYKTVNFKAICKTFPSKKVFLMYPTCQFCHTCNLQAYKPLNLYWFCPRSIINHCFFFALGISTSGCQYNWLRSHCNVSLSMLSIQRNSFLHL